jgi:plasmid stabilization system protein ParE
MPQVVWHARALADIERLSTFLRKKDATAAQKVAYTILQASSLLETSPQIGRPMSDSTSRREIVITFGAGAYIIRYVWEDNKNVVIVRVWHSKENRLQA